MKNGYIPKTSIIGIPHSSFGVQLGEYQLHLALMIYRGKNLYESVKFDDMEINEPNKFDSNRIIGAIMKSIRFNTGLELNPYQIFRIVGVLTNQIKKNNSK